MLALLVKTLRSLAGSLECRLSHSNRRSRSGVLLREFARFGIAVKHFPLQKKALCSESRQDFRLHRLNDRNS